MIYVWYDISFARYNILVSTPAPHSSNLIFIASISRSEYLHPYFISFFAIDGLHLNQNNQMESKR